MLTSCFNVENWASLHSAQPTRLDKTLFGMPTEMNIEKTQSGTIISNGIEYNDYPTPRLLVKAMERQYAIPLIESGELKIQHFDYFRKWENKVLGDPDDGNGQYHVNGHPMESESVNDVYAWCLSLPEITSNRLALFKEQGEYDCLVVISNPEAMFQRINEWLLKNHNGFMVHCGAIKYDRSQEIDVKTLNSQQFHYNVFQKAASFKEDREYRLSITNCTFSRLLDKHIDLAIGNCRDIASIEELPNSMLG
jgi:hypothetical protein